MKLHKTNHIAQSIGYARTSQFYLELCKEATDAGYIQLNDKTQAGLDQAVKYGTVAVSQGKTFPVLHDRNYTSAKVMALMPDVARLPLRESNRAAKRRVELLHKLFILRGLNVKNTGNDALYSVFLTFTVKNCDMGQLANTVELMKKMLHQTKDYLRKTNPITKNHALGGLPALEVTMNKDKMAAQDPHGVFHPHLHVILLLNTKPTEEVLASLQKSIYAKWEKLATRNGLTVKDVAFGCEPAYSAPDVLDTTGSAAVKEAIKYATKPDNFNRLALTAKNHSNGNGHDDYYLRLFAENYNLYNSNDTGHSKNQFNPFGLLYEAGTIYTFVKDNDLEGLLFERAEGDVNKVPTYYTQESTLEVTRLIEDANNYVWSNKYNKAWSMTDEEVARYREQLDLTQCNDRSKSGERYNGRLKDTQDLSNAELIYYNQKQLGGLILRGWNVKKAHDIITEALTKARNKAREEETKKLKRLIWKLESLDWLTANWFTPLQSLDDYLSASDDYQQTIINDYHSTDEDGDLTEEADNRLHDLEDVEAAVKHNYSLTAQQRLKEQETVRKFSRIADAQLMQRIAQELGVIDLYTRNTVADDLNYGRVSSQLAPTTHKLLDSYMVMNYGLHLLDAEEYEDAVDKHNADPKNCRKPDIMQSPSYWSGQGKHELELLKFYVLDDDRYLTWGNDRKANELAEFGGDINTASISVVLNDATKKLERGISQLLEGCDCNKACYLAA